ncbi:hypothetical protein JCM5350_002535 [Sporobolomyces pararoseus]
MYLSVLSKILYIFIWFVQAGLAQTNPPPSSSSSSLTSSFNDNNNEPTQSYTALVQRPTSIPLSLSTHEPEDEKRFSPKKKLRKRCWYVGTFFQRIDCNALANSTRIPYSHSARQQPHHSSNNLLPSSSSSVSSMAPGRTSHPKKKKY